MCVGGGGGGEGGRGGGGGGCLGLYREWDNNCHLKEEQL